MHSHLVVSIVNALEQLLQQGGYWIVTLVACVEALPFIGSIVPGHTIVIAGGFFARLGMLNVYVLMALASAGAVVGDCIGYYMGKRYGYSFLNKYSKYFLVSQENLDKGRALISNHSGKALVLGRFNPISRAFMPFFAGASHVKLNKFWAYNIMGGVLWAVSSVLVGYIFGASYEVVAKYVGRFTLIGIILSILLIFTYQFINKQRHIFAKYQLYTLIVSVFSLYIFFKTLQDVASLPSFMANLDVWFAEVINSMQTGWLFTAMSITSHIFSPETLLFATFGITIWHIYKRYWHNVWIAMCTYPIGLGIGYTFKAIVERARPVTMFINETGYSFPSGHAMASALFFSFLIYLALHHIHHKLRRELAIVACIILIFLIGMSRLYLGVHWFSDVAAGYAFGVFWFTFMILVIRYVEALTGGRKAKKLH